MVENLGHYKILDRIGAGGIGDVYRARDTRLGRTMAIKMVAPAILQDAERRAKFFKDARAAAALSHPNIATLDEVRDEPEHPCLVFEFAGGESLKAAIGGRPMNPRTALDTAVQIADALADIHTQGIVYQDLKPDNVVITAKGAAKLLDVGLGNWTSGHTTRQQVVRAPDKVELAALKTVAYMSPEQVLGSGVDHRTDLFSLGAILFEMLTGRPAFNATHPGQLPLQIVQSHPPDPSSLNRAVPKEVDPIVSRLLAKSLDARYESAATAAAELRSVAAILDVRTESAEMRDVPVARPKRGSMLGWLVAILILAGVGILVWMATRIQ